MESPNLSIRIRRHETLPCPAFNPAHGKSTAPTCGLRRHRTQAHTTASILIGRRLGATKNNPYVGSFRHSPPTSLRSMEASSLPSLSSRKDPSSMLLSPMFFMTTKRSESPSTSLAALSSSVPAMKTSPYVGWFRHAPPSILSFSHVHSAKNNKKDDQRNESKVSRAALVQHKVNHNCLQELDRWHQQLTSLLMGIDNGTSCKESKESPPLMLRRIINGRLLGGSGKHDRNLMENIPQDNISGSRSIMNMADVTNPGYSSILLRLTSWLLFPLLYADEDCYDEFGFIGSEGKLKATDSRLLLPSQHDERSIEIDSDDEMDSDDDDSFASNYDYNERYNEKGISPETEREFKEMNVSVSEIAETYYAHQLLEDRDNDSSAQSPLSPSSYHNTNGDSFVTRQRLDYEITQMDIARMTRNASRHLDVDSILTLPTIIYRRKQRSNFSPTSVRNEAKCLTQDGEQSYHHVCRPIPEGKAKHSTADRKREFQILEDGWSFLMVSGVKREERGSQISNGDALDPIDVVDEASELKQCNDDVCVICLEPFKEGDRLRVLPCDHSFHVGCIDRWLSGSHSHNECFTAGCPTCKKRPTSSPHSPSLPRIDTSVNMEKEADVDGEIMSGSLPSWAFANLGSAMAMSSGGFPDS